MKFKINDLDDRKNTINALINNGYKVWVEEEKIYKFDSTVQNYWVCFEAAGLESCESKQMLFDQFCESNYKDL